MTIKLALLKSGEEVISDMTEMMSGQDGSGPIVADWVISIVEPQDKLLEMYTKAVKTYEDRQSTNSDTNE